MRNILAFFVFFLAVAFVMLRFSELENVAHTLNRTDLRFLGLALAVQVAWMLNEAAEFRSLFRLMGINEKIPRLFMLSAAMNFINVVAPTGGFGGMAVFLDNAGKRGQPRGRVAATGALYLFLDYAAFLFVLALGILVLVRRNNLGNAEIIASILMLGLVIGLGALIYTGSRSAKRLGEVLAWLARQVNRVLRVFIRRDYLNEERSHEFAAEMSEGLSILHGDLRNLGQPLLFALNNKVLMTAVLMMAFLDFQVSFTLGTLIAGVAIAYLFLVISPTPSGIGIVEGVLPLALSSLRVPWEDAVVVTLVYRAVTFWFPLGLGGLAFRLLQRE